MRSLRHRVDELVALFDAIGRTRMAGVPVMNGALGVAAVGFAALDDGSESLGVLITPWFMNLVRLPLVRTDDTASVGRTRPLALNGRSIDFIGAHESAIGSFDACSLFSPVFEFADMPAARATAQAVLAELRSAPAAQPAPARRSFLFGRSAAVTR